MKPEDSVEKAIREKFRFAAGSGLRDRMLTRALDAQKKSRRSNPAPFEPGIGRTTMKSPIAKLAIAAAIGIAVVLSISLWNKSTPAAYAVEQTVEALQNVRFLHIIGYDEAGQVKDERWIEIGMDGYQVRYRQQNPAWVIERYPSAPAMVIEDGESTAVYRSDKKAVILYDRKDMQYQWVGELGKAFENLRQEGVIHEENAEYKGRRAHKVWWPYMKAECYIDPDTKLPIAIGDTELTYEVPPAGTFDIFTPEGYAVADRRPGATEPLPQWLLEEENTGERKRACFREGTYALARGDYATAAEQLEKAIGCDSWAWFWLGSAYYSLGQYESAIGNFNELFRVYEEHAPDWKIPYCHYARGLAYAKSGNLDAAKADLQLCLPRMIQTLRTPSAGSMFEYADNPMIRYGKYQPTEHEVVTHMINRLRIVSGRNFGYDPEASAEENEAAIAAWEQWFADGGSINVTFDTP